MTENEGKKQPIEMTSDELLDYALAPELAEKLRQMAHPEESESEAPEDEEC